MFSGAPLPGYFQFTEVGKNIGPALERQTCFVQAVNNFFA